MRYIPPFQALQSRTAIRSIRGQLMVQASYDTFVDLFRSVIENIDIDEAWYLERHPDVAEAVSAGTFKSAKDHFMNNGYFEGRLPFAIKVDEAYYLNKNPEVADFVKRELLADGQQHFDENGYLEGRKPFPTGS